MFFVLRLQLLDRAAELLNNNLGDDLVEVDKTAMKGCFSVTVVLY